jgi:hypothetical protein
MKLLFLAIAATSFFQIQKCEALNISDIIGNWKLKGTVVEYGKKIQLTGPTTITSEMIGYDWEGGPYQATVVRSYIKIKGAPQIFSEEFFFDDGDYYSSTSEGNSAGEAFEESYGNWEVSENKIYLNISSYYYDTDEEIYSASYTYTVKGRKKIVVSGTSSVGGRASAVYTRKGK